MMPRRRQRVVSRNDCMQPTHQPVIKFACAKFAVCRARG
jgi:hypothetical protein